MKCPGYCTPSWILGMCIKGIQMIPDHGNHQKRWTLFGRYLFKLLSELNVKPSIKYSRLVPDKLIETQKLSVKLFLGLQKT